MIVIAHGRWIGLPCPRFATTTLRCCPQCCRQQTQSIVDTFDCTAYPSAYDLELACEEDRFNDVVAMRNQCNLHHLITDIVYEEDSAFKTACQKNRVKIPKDFEMEWDLRAFDLYEPPTREDWGRERKRARLTQGCETNGDVKCATCRTFAVRDSADGLFLAAKNRHFETLQFLYKLTRNDLTPQLARMVHRVYVELSATHMDVIAFMLDRWGVVLSPTVSTNNFMDTFSQCKS
eukprot:m.770407 g.770407  ORF g.770407 m.770407 type:complete len:234 (-) comp23240_c0_seq17:3655-4356(-)